MGVGLLEFQMAVAGKTLRLHFVGYRIPYSQILGTEDRNTAVGGRIVKYGSVAVKALSSPTTENSK